MKTTKLNYAAWVAAGLAPAQAEKPKVVRKPHGPAKSRAIPIETRVAAVQFAKTKDGRLLAWTERPGKPLVKHALSESGCSCPAFKFSRGSKTCKHLEAAASRKIVLPAAKVRRAKKAKK